MRRAVGCATERIQLPVLVVGGETVGGIREVKRSLESGDLHSRLKAHHIPFTAS